MKMCTCGARMRIYYRDMCYPDRDMFICDECDERVSRYAYLDKKMDIEKEVQNNVNKLQSRRY